jgi:hypothetical protein
MLLVSKWDFIRLLHLEQVNRKFCYAFRASGHMRIRVNEITGIVGKMRRSALHTFGDGAFCSEKR